VWSSANVAITGTTAVISNLASGTPYEFQVLAKNNVGPSDWSPSTNVTTDTGAVSPPTAPGDVRSVGVKGTPTVNSITIQWTAPSNPGTTNGTTLATISRYVVKYATLAAYNTGSQNAAFWSGISSTANVTGTEATASSLESNTAYVFYIVAENSAGLNSPGEVFGVDGSVMTTKLVTPGNVTGFTISDPKMDSLSLSWNAVLGATTYEIQYRITTDAKGNPLAPNKLEKQLWVTQIIEITTPAVTITGLKANVGYQFQVRAVNVIGKSDWSAISTATRTAEPQITAENPDLAKAKFSTKPKAAGMGTASSAIVSWGSVPGATSYVITYTIPSGVKGVPGTTISKVLTGEAASGGMITYTIEGLKSSLSYKVSIVAQNASGTTTKAVTVTAKTLKVAAPTKLASNKSANTHSSILLTWQPPKTGLGNAKGYVIEVWAPAASKGAVPELVQVLWADGSEFSKEVKDLQGGATKYTFRLTTSTGSGLEGFVVDRGIESAVASKVISTAK
jgi:hypothetical protein